MRLRHLTWTSVVVALAISGCASQRNLEVLETAMRQQEDQLAAVQQQLLTARGELEVSQNEISRLRSQLAQNGQQTHSPEHLENEFKAVGLRFNSYLTSGIDRDGQPGDELLSVLLYPHDEQGGLVKLAGEVELKAVDLSAPKGQHEVGSWTFTPAETRGAWHSGFLAAGFLFEQPWQSLPQGSDVTLHARFKTVDGRQFEAVQPLRVKTAAVQPLAQGASRTVQAGKPTVLPASHRPSKGAKLDQDEVLEDPFPREDGVIEREDGVIETSDRYRSFEIPTLR